MSMAPQKFANAAALIKFNRPLQTRWWDWGGMQTANNNETAPYVNQIWKSRPQFAIDWGKRKIAKDQ